MFAENLRQDLQNRTQDKKVKYFEQSLSDIQNKLLKRDHELTLEQLAFLEYTYSYFSPRNDFAIERIKKNLHHETQRSIELTWASKFRKDAKLHLTYIKNEHPNADWKLLADYLLATWDHIPIENELS